VTVVVISVVDVKRVGGKKSVIYSLDQHYHGIIKFGYIPLFINNLLLAVAAIMMVM
jgi:hypothetical protein